MSAVPEPSFRRRIGYQAGLLGGFATLAAALLMMGHLATRDTILLRQQEDLLASLGQVLPARLYDEPLLDNVLAYTGPDGLARTVYRAVRDGRVTAVAFQVRGAGYAGAIDLLLGVEAGGALLGVRVLAHAETPGLGDKIEIAKHDWIRAFAGRSLGDPPEDRWAVRKDGGVFDQFSGATITPRAVVGAVKDGLLYFGRHRGTLLARAPVIDLTPAAGD